MDIRDASMNPKDKNDWHRLLADSAEDQAERQNRECECTDCSCVKEVRFQERVCEPKYTIRLKDKEVSVMPESMRDLIDINTPSKFANRNTQSIS